MRNPVNLVRFMADRLDESRTRGVVSAGIWSLGFGLWDLSCDWLVFQGRQIHVPDVFLHHAARAEAGEYRPHRLLDDLQPAARQAVAVALVERGDDLLFENRVERLRIGP